MELDYDGILDEVIRVLAEQGVAARAGVRGCSREEIAAVERNVGVQLPKSFVAFLSRMGRGAGRFYYGSDFFFPSILGLRAAAQRLVSEDPAQIKLPVDAVVFSMHQGYQFLFIRPSEGDDPPVYHYCERDGAFTRKHDSFTGYLLAVARDNW